MDKGKKHNKNFAEMHITLFFFFSFTIISLLLLFYLQKSTISTLEKSQQQIIDHYEYTLKISTNNSEILPVDYCSYAKVFGLTPPQTLLFQNYTNSIIGEAVARAHVDFEASSLVAAKASAMFQETKDLLEMQFAKIRQESESLQIWIGILTLVFLVFSFYSFFKVDEIMRQGRDGLNELNTLKERGDNKINQFEEKSKEVMTKAISDRNAIMKDVAEHIKLEEKKFDDLISNAIVELDKKYQVLSSELENICKHAKDNENIPQQN